MFWLNKYMHRFALFGLLESFKSLKSLNENGLARGKCYE